MINGVAGLGTTTPHPLLSFHLISASTQSFLHMEIYENTFNSQIIREWSEHYIDFHALMLAANEAETATHSTTPRGTTSMASRSVTGNAARLGDVENGLSTHTYPPQQAAVMTTTKLSISTAVTALTSAKTWEAGAPLNQPTAPTTPDAETKEWHSSKAEMHAPATTATTATTTNKTTITTKIYTSDVSSSHSNIFDTESSAENFLEQNFFNSAEVALNKLTISEINKVQEFYATMFSELKERLKIGEEQIIEYNTKKALSKQMDSYSSLSDMYPLNVTAATISATSLASGSEKEDVVQDKTPIYKKPSWKGQHDASHESLKRALTDVYKTATMLQAFALVNCAGLQKIIGANPNGFCQAHLRAIVFNANEEQNPQTYVQASMQKARDWTISLWSRFVSTPSNPQTSSETTPLKSGMSSNAPTFANLPTVEFFQQKTAAFFAENGEKPVTFSNEEELEQLIEDIEKSFAKHFNYASATEAKAHLVAKDTPNFRFRDFNFGVRCGIAATMLLWMLWDASAAVLRMISDKTKVIILPNVPITSTSGFPVIRALCLIVLAYWGYAMDCIFWTRARINYIYLFALNSHYVRPPQDMLFDAASISIFVLLISLLYYQSVIGLIPYIISPSVYLVIGMAYLIIRLTVPFNPSLLELLKVIISIITAPFSGVTFLSVFMADWMTSLVRVFIDLIYSACYFATSKFSGPESEIKNLGHCQDNATIKFIIVPIICVLPLWFRFMQNLRRIYDTNSYYPHVLNALKYALAQTVVLFGIFHPFDETSSMFFQVFWIILFSCSSLYAFVWDVVFDWGLGDAKYNFLASRQMFPHKSFYYASIILDCILRHTWMLTFLPPIAETSFRGTLPKFLAGFMGNTFTMTLEIVRRTVWGIFRLENEHLRNTQGFKHTSLVPMHFEGKDDAGASSKTVNRFKYVELGLFAFIVLVISYFTINPTNLE